jgi:hypothetical protein
MGGGEEIFVYLGRKGRLMLDYLRLSPMIGGGSLSLKANERTTKRERSHNGEKERQGSKEKTESAEENRAHYWRV